ncbi:unnamed protein product [Nezara viridula]|uniref:Uncharacterized protein n=1 Tax=Nezara viridula TaxID=85310 RepID=A0A9P0H810_NEZVI|nr:unnamed protein product [Nezara viridula]
MKIFTAICMALILTMIPGESEGIVEYSRGRLTTVTPAFIDSPEEKKEAFFKIPTSKRDPLFKEFKYYHVVINLPVKFYCYPNDPSFCLIFDYMGTIAGIQIGYLEQHAKEVDPIDYNFENNTNYIKTKICNKSIYAVRIWFTNPEELKECGRTDHSEVIEGLWTYVDGHLMRFDQRCQTVGPSIGCFDLQGCVPMKGTLYIYNFNKYSSCKFAFFLFLIYDRHSLVGVGHAAPGNFPPGPHRDWFDRPKGEKLAQITPSVPHCFAHLLKYGLTSSVTFLIDDPHNIKCPVCGC